MKKTILTLVVIAISTVAFAQGLTRKDGSHIYPKSQFSFDLSPVFYAKTELTPKSDILTPRPSISGHFGMSYSQILYKGFGIKFGANAGLVTYYWGYDGGFGYSFRMDDFLKYSLNGAIIKCWDLKAPNKKVLVEVGISKTRVDLPEHSSRGGFGDGKSYTTSAVENSFYSGLLKVGIQHYTKRQNIWTYGIVYNATNTEIIEGEYFASGESGSYSFKPSYLGFDVSLGLGMNKTRREPRRRFSEKWADKPSANHYTAKHLLGVHATPLITQGSIIKGATLQSSPKAGIKYGLSYTLNLKNGLGLNAGLSLEHVEWNSGFLLATQYNGNFYEILYSGGKTENLKTLHFGLQKIVGIPNSKLGLVAAVNAKVSRFYSYSRETNYGRFTSPDTTNWFFTYNTNMHEGFSRGYRMVIGLEAKLGLVAKFNNGNNHQLLFVASYSPSTIAKGTYEINFENQNPITGSFEYKLAYIGVEYRFDFSLDKLIARVRK